MISLTCPYKDCKKEIQVVRFKTEGKCPHCKKYFYVMTEEHEHDEDQTHWLEPIE